MTPGAAAPLRFGRFELQSDERRLLVDGAPAALGGRAFDLLLALAERPGQLVGKHALMDLVWPGLVVQENNLAAQISALRKVLGDELIATIPGRGYRFVVPIEAAAAPDQSLSGAAPARDRPAASASECAPICLPSCPPCSDAPTSWMRWLRCSSATASSASSAREGSASPCWRSTCSPRIARPIRRACAGSSSRIWPMRPTCREPWRPPSASTSAMASRWRR